MKLARRNETRAILKLYSHHSPSKQNTKIVFLRKTIPEPRATPSPNKLPTEVACSLQYRLTEMYIY
jgi:hypothetical protein